VDLSLSRKLYFRVTYFAASTFKTPLALVSYSHDITGIVRFGDRIPTIPDSTLEQLKAALPGETVEIKTPALKEGELVEIITGCFQGESGQVTKVDQAIDRVSLLIEFLGNQVQIQLPSSDLINLNPANPGISLGLQSTSDC
jgi:transcription antitermination factor NusG